MSTVSNSRGVQVCVYSTWGAAVNAEVVEPIQNGLDTDEDARTMFDIDAIADAVLEWHTEWIDRDGQQVEWLPLNGFCSALGDEPQEFWDIVVANMQGGRAVSYQHVQALADAYGVRLSDSCPFTLWGRVWLDRWRPAYHSEAGFFVGPGYPALWRPGTDQERAAFQARATGHQHTTGRVWDDALYVGGEE